MLYWIKRGCCPWLLSPLFELSPTVFQVSETKSPCFMMSDEELDMPGMLPFSNDVLLAVNSVEHLVLFPYLEKKEHANF